MRRGALFALLLLGCESRFVATPNDYADYRAVRLAPSFDDRLAAASRYLAKRPDGRYAAPLRSYFDAAEPVYFKVRSQTAAGLEAYLAALPDGPHAQQALAALVDKRNAQRKDELAERATRAMLLRIAAEEQSRKGVAGLVLWWVRALLDPAPWHGTFSDAPKELLARFRMSSPQPECVTEDDGAQQCTKTIERRFRVRSGAGEVDETMALTIAVSLDPEYRLQRVVLRGPALALRSREAAAGEVASEKQSAGAWRELVDRVSQAVIADNRICNGGEDASGVLTLACEDPAVTLTLAPGAEETITLARGGK